jgi:hypothetical protein
MCIRKSSCDNSLHAHACMCFAGTQSGILKAAKRPGKASFISSIDERLATSHALLYDVDRKVRESARTSEFERQSLRVASYTEHTQNQVKDMVPAIGKLLARNDDIAAVLLPAIVTALEKVHSFCARGMCKYASQSFWSEMSNCMHGCAYVHVSYRWMCTCMCIFWMHVSMCVHTLHRLSWETMS